MQLNVIVINIFSNLILRSQKLSTWKKKLISAQHKQIYKEKTKKVISKQLKK